MHCKEARVPWANQNGLKGDQSRNVAITIRGLGREPSHPLRELPTSSDLEECGLCAIPGGDPFNPYNECWGYFHPKHTNAKIVEKHLNPVILVLIRKLSLSTLRWVPICQGFSHFSGFLHHLAYKNLWDLALWMEVALLALEGLILVQFQCRWPLSIRDPKNQWVNVWSGKIREMAWGLRLDTLAPALWDNLAWTAGDWGVRKYSLSQQGVWASFGHPNLLNHPLGHPKHLGSNFLKCHFQA